MINTWYYSYSKQFDSQYDIEYEEKICRKKLLGLNFCLRLTYMKNIEKKVFHIVDRGTLDCSRVRTSAWTKGLSSTNARPRAATSSGCSEKKSMWLPRWTILGSCRRVLQEAWTCLQVFLQVVLQTAFVPARFDGFLQVFLQVDRGSCRSTEVPAGGSCRWSVVPAGGTNSRAKSSN
jgi:hypothetical protein